MAEQEATTETTQTTHPTLAEDLLLVLFQPGSGTFAGETTLYYVLAGALLTELALDDRVITTNDRPSLARVAVVPETQPEDALLRSAWDYAARKPRHVQTILAAIGPTLRAPIVQRLIERGDLVEHRRRILGVIPSMKLMLGTTGRRHELIASVRAVLVDGHEPTPRVAALTALFYATGTMSWFYREIPWTSTVIERAQELKKGNWGAGAAAQAVARTIAAVIANNVIVATTVANRS